MAQKDPAVGRFVVFQTSPRIDVRLQSEFIYLSCMAKELLREFEEYEIMPTISSDLSSILTNHSIVQSNILTDALDVRLYIDLFNNTNNIEIKRELSNKLRKRASDGSTDCFEALGDALKRMREQKRQYFDAITRFNKNKEIVL